MKYSIFTVSMPKTEPKDAVKKIKSCGGHGVEWRINCDNGDTEKPGFWSGNRCTLQDSWSDEQFEEIAVATRDAGLVVPNLGTYCKADNIELVERMMNVAKIFDSPSLRVNLEGYNGETPYPELLKKMQDQLAQVIELGKKYEVKPLVETHHGTILPSAGLAYNLISCFRADEIGVIYDPGNMVHEGFENHQMGMELLGEYLAYVHIKSAMPTPVAKNNPQRLGFNVAWASPRAGMVNFENVFKAMKAVGYDGWLSIEDFSTGMDDEWIIEDSFDFLTEMQERV